MSEASLNQGLEARLALGVRNEKVHDVGGHFSFRRDPANSPALFDSSGSL